MIRNYSFIFMKYGGLLCMRKRTESYNSLRLNDSIMHIVFIQVNNPPPFSPWGVFPFYFISFYVLYVKIFQMDPPKHFQEKRWYVNDKNNIYPQALADKHFPVPQKKLMQSNKCKNNFTLRVTKERNAVNALVFISYIN